LCRSIHIPESTSLQFRLANIPEDDIRVALKYLGKFADADDADDGTGVFHGMIWNGSKIKISVLRAMAKTQNVMPTSTGHYDAVKGQYRILFS